jgi:hypothetical protein
VSARAGEIVEAEPRAANVDRERRLQRSQPAALVPVECHSARSRSKTSTPKPTRRYGLRQEEDRKRAVPSAARAFQDCESSKTFVVAIE